jgi:GH15 family glucan-1,4-alpha-glucosidase
VAADLGGMAKKMHADICKQTWNEQMQSFVSSFNGNDLDASLLLLAELQFVAPTDPRFVSTVHAVAKRLKVGELLMRYAHADDFGKPEVAFIVCTFWYVMALTAIGERAEARRLFEILVSKRNAHGLLSEDLSLDGKDELWGARVCCCICLL